MNVFYTTMFIFISSIPFVDKLITRNIYNIKYTKKISCVVTDYITTIDFIICFCLYMWYNLPLKIVFIKYFIDLIINNFMFKWHIYRKRPRNSLLINKKYIPVYNLTLKNSNKHLANSFFSGHVGNICLSYYLYKSHYNNYLINNIYYIFLILTIFSRINLGAHFFSDCLFAIFFDYLFISFFNLF